MKVVIRSGMAAFAINVLIVSMFACASDLQEGSSNFGQVTHQVNRPRQIQFSARINF